MTFADLRTILRREIIVDLGTDAYPNDTIDDVAWNAAYEIAATFGFPRVLKTDVATVAGNTTIAAPADAVSVLSLTVGGFDADPADIRTVLQQRFGKNGPIKYFNFDPRRGQTIQVAPAISYAGADSIMEYVQSLTKPTPASAIGATAIWGGLMPQFHYIVTYRTAVKLFDMAERYEDIGVWAPRQNDGLAAMSAYLNGVEYSALVLSATGGGGE